MKKTLASIIFFSLILTSCGNEEIIEKKTYKTYTAAEGTIASSESVLATLEGKNTTSLAFKNPGRIERFLVKAGDTVKAGQALATLSNEEATISLAGSNDILSQIEDMGADINEISANTVKVRDSIDSLYDERLKLLEDSYQKAKIATKMAEKDLALAKTNHKDLSQVFSGTLTTSDQKIRQAENAYDMAKNNLENSKRLLDTEKANIIRNAQNSLANAYIIARNSMEFTDVLLGMTKANMNKNIDYEMYLGAKKPQTKNIAESSFWILEKRYTSTYALYSDKIVNKKDIPEDTIIEVLESANSTLEALRNHLHDVKDMLDFTIPAATLTDDTINNMKMQVTAMMANLEQVILSPNGAGVKGSLEMISSFDSTYELKIKQLEDALKIASEDKNLAKTGKDITRADNSKNLSGLETNISIKEDSLALSKIGEEEVLKNITLVKQERISKLAELDAKISEVQSKMSEAGSKKAEVRMNEDLAKNGVESGIIRAPFDGIVLKKNLDEGSVVGAGMPVISLTSTDAKVLKTYIDNAKYRLIIGDEVRLFDERTRETFTGTVSDLNDVPDLINRKNHIEITVEDGKAKIGNRYIISISSAEAQSKSIIIPNKAIISKYGTPGVLTLNNKKAVFRIIKIIDSDTGFSSVTGLNKGDIVITDGKDNILDGEILE